MKYLITLVLALGTVHVLLLLAGMSGLIDYHTCVAPAGHCPF